jgi:hypothetical protein
MKNIVQITALTSLVVVLTACGTGAPKPAASEFGFGPRTSGQARYTATLQPDGELKARKMYAVRVAIADAKGRPVEGATIAVDGGMPEHGHGLPTRPRVTRSEGDGVYVIEGLRFNMGGWWELKLAIDGTAGPDSITFNIEV